MHYYQPGSSVVWTSKPPNDKYTLESFNPTRPELKKGFLVWYDYTSYDSYGPSEIGSEYCVVDLYEHYKSAKKMAELIREYLNAEHRYNRGRSQDDIRKDFFFAATTDRDPYLPLGWGTSVNNIYVDEVEVLDVTEKMKRQRVF